MFFYKLFSANDDCALLELDRYNIDRICLKDLPIDLNQPAVSILLVDLWLFAF